MIDLSYWAPYACFHYSRKQIRWLIDNEDSFEAGRWPQEPRGEYITEGYDKHERRWVEKYGCGSTFEDKQGKPPAQSEAPFCKTLEIYGDVLRRIQRADTDGKLLLAQLRAGYDCLDEEALNAMDYASGYREKTTPYRKWLWKRENRQICVK